MRRKSRTPSKSPNKILPKKHLGQNFLTDQRITEKIISACELTDDETIIEIGPGLGVLTHGLAQKAKQVIAIETDKQLYQNLIKKFTDTNINLIHADFLKYPLSNLSQKVKVVGNLPYYISTPIIKKILMNQETCHSFYATVQLELGQRLTASPNNKTYGAFTCFAQYFSDVKMLFRIKNTAFKPVPKVNSCFIKFDLTKRFSTKAKDEKLLFRIIRQAFGKRRKTIANSLCEITSKTRLTEVLAELNLNPKLRAENLALKDYVSLANLLFEK